eukprot:CAMPEP_0201627712 /NCGR_PEP_ID=MMETSP0493-20130528/2842_1 /ASSEMBLY_ACC=CAM_ASM_000838 /TAXON_ID=420259 /ORGANISM="Thalassiosira gravida, Strain GMp14c1" /LENGTH=85 /DNA_ID=CAMNT_0048098255 /DNA_START=16 /DNA_END=269 /DNA_ORIENTATION=-
MYALTTRLLSGCLNFNNALASIFLMSCFSTPNLALMSASPNGSPSSSPNRNRITACSLGDSVRTNLRISSFIISLSAISLGLGCS